MAVNFRLSSYNRPVFVIILVQSLFLCPKPYLSLQKFNENSRITHYYVCNTADKMTNTVINRQIMVFMAKYNLLAKGNYTV